MDFMTNSADPDQMSSNGRNFNISFTNMLSLEHSPDINNVTYMEGCHCQCHEKKEVGVGIYPRDSSQSFLALKPEI
jgi:hypothetical protein